MKSFYESPIENNPYDTATGLARRQSGQLEGPTAYVGAPGQNDLVDPGRNSWLTQTARSHAAGMTNDLTNGVEYLARGLVGDTAGRQAAADAYLKEQETVRASGPAIQSFEDAQAAGGGVGNYAASLAYMGAGLVPDAAVTLTGVGIGGTLARRGARQALKTSLADGIEAEAGNAARRSMAGSVARSEARAAATAAPGGPEAVSGAVRVATAQVNEASRKAAMAEAARISGRTPRMGIGADTAVEAATRVQQGAITAAGTTGGRVGGTLASIPTLNGSANAEKAASADTTTADMWALAAGTTAAAATQVLPLERFLGKFGAQARAQVAMDAQKFLPRAAREALAQGTAEGTQEVAQQALQNASHAYVEGNMGTLVGPKAFEQYLASFLAGSILGGAMGAGGVGARSAGDGVVGAAKWTRDKTGAAYQAARGRIATLAQGRRDAKAATEKRYAPGEPMPSETSTAGRSAGDVFKQGVDAVRGFATTAGSKANELFNKARDGLKQNEDLDGDTDALFDDADRLYNDFETGADPIVDQAELAANQLPFEMPNKLQSMLMTFVPRDSGWFDSPKDARELGATLERLFSGAKLSSNDHINLLASGIPTARQNSWAETGPKASEAWAAARAKTQEMESAGTADTGEYALQRYDADAQRREVLDEGETDTDYAGADETDGGQAQGFEPLDLAPPGSTLSDIDASRSALRDRLRENRQSIRAAKAFQGTSRDAAPDLKGLYAAEAEIMAEAKALAEQETVSKEQAVVAALGQTTERSPVGAFTFVENRSTKANAQSGKSGADAYKAALADPTYVRLEKQQNVPGITQPRNVLVNLATAARVFQGENTGTPGREAVMAVLARLVDAGIEIDVSSLTPGPIVFKPNAKAEGETIYVLKPDDIAAFRAQIAKPYDRSISDAAAAKRAESRKGARTVKRKQKSPEEVAQVGSAFARGFTKTNEDGVKVGDVDAWVADELSQITDPLEANYRGDNLEAYLFKQYPKSLKQARKRVEDFAARDRAKLLRDAGSAAQEYQADQTAQGDDPFGEEERRYKQGPRPAPPGVRNVDQQGFTPSLSVVSDVSLGSMPLNQLIKKTLRRLSVQLRRNDSPGNAWVSFIRLPRINKLREKQTDLAPQHRAFFNAVTAVENAADALSALKVKSKGEKKKAQQAIGQRAYEATLDREIHKNSAAMRARAIDSALGRQLDENAALAEAYEAFFQARAAARNTKEPVALEEARAAGRKALKVEGLKEFLRKAKRADDYMQTARDESVPTAEAARGAALEKAKSNTSLTSAKAALRRAEKRLDKLSADPGTAKDVAAFFTIENKIQAAFDTFMKVDAVDIEAMAIEATKARLKKEHQLGFSSQRRYLLLIKDIDEKGAAHPEVAKMIDAESGGFNDATASTTDGKVEDERAVNDRASTAEYESALERATSAYKEIYRKVKPVSESGVRIEAEAFPSERDLYDLFTFLEDRTNARGWNQRGYKLIRDYVLALQELAEWGYTPSLAAQLEGKMGPGAKFLENLAANNKVLPEVQKITDEETELPPYQGSLSLRRADLKRFDPPPKDTARLEQQDDLGDGKYGLDLANKRVQARLSELGTVGWQDPELTGWGGRNKAQAEYDGLSQYLTVEDVMTATKMQRESGVVPADSTQENGVVGLLYLKQLIADRAGFKNYLSYVLDRVASGPSVSDRAWAEYDGDARVQEAWDKLSPVEKMAANARRLAGKDAEQDEDLGDGLDAAAATAPDGHDYAAETTMLNVMAKAMGLSANLEVRTSGAMSLNKGGSYHRGTRIIKVNSNLTGAERVEVLMHELGHHVVWDAVAKVVGWDALKNIDLAQALELLAFEKPKLYAALKSDFAAYRAKHGPFASKLAIKADRAPLQRANRAMKEKYEAEAEAYKNKEAYNGVIGDTAWNDENDMFHEWLADNIARALTTQKTPVSLIGKFFGKIATAIRSAWNKLSPAQRKKYLPAKSVDGWVREMFNAEAAAMNAVTGANAPRADVVAVTRTAMVVYQAKMQGDPDQFSEAIGPQPAFKIEDIEGFKAAVRTMLKPQERQILLRALSTRQAIMTVRARINEIYKDDPESRDTMLKDWDSGVDGMESRIAIGYMLWQKGQLRVGPNSTSVLHGLTDDLLNFVNLAGDGDYAQRIFSDIANGTITRFHAANAPYDVRKLEARARGKAQVALDKVRDAYDTAMEPVSKVFSSQMQRMRQSGLPSMARLAGLLARSSSTTGDELGLNAAIVDNTASFMRKADRVLAPLSDRQRIKVLSRMQRQIKPNGKQPHIDAAMAGLGKVFDEAYDYMKAAGVDVGARKNFFPVVFDLQNQRAATTLNNLYMAKEKDADGKDTEVFRYEKPIREFFAATQKTRERDNAAPDAPSKPLPAANPEHLEYFNRERETWRPGVAAVNESIIAAVTTGSIANLRTQIAASEAREARRKTPDANLARAFRIERRYMAARIKQLEEAGFAENEGSATQRTGPKTNKETPFEDLVKNLVEGALNDGDQIRKPGTAPGFRGAKFRASQFIYDRGDAADIKAFASIQSKAASEIFARYFEPMVKHAEFTQRLGGGKDNRDKFDALLASMKVEGATPAQIEEAENAVAAALGAYGVDGSPVLRMLSPSLADKFSGPKTKAAVQSLQAYQNLRLLPLSLLSSLVDPMGIAVRTGGDFATAWQGFKTGMKGVLNGTSRDDQLAMLEVLGSSEDMLPALAAGAGFSGAGVPAARKVNDFVFKANGMQRWVMATRFMAMQSGHAFLLKHAQLAATDDTSRRYLAELNVEPADIKEVWTLPSAGGGSARRTVEINDKTRAALSRFVNDAILRPHSQQVPLWYNDPYVGLVTQYKGFLYAIYEQIGGRIGRELDHGNLRVALPTMAYVPVVILAELLREFIQYGLEGNPTRTDWGPSDYAVMGVQRTGLLGPKFDAVQGAVQDAKAGRTVGSSQLGPALGQAKNIVEAVNGRRSISQEFENALPFNPAYKNRVNPLSSEPGVPAPAFVPQGNF